MKQAVSFARRTSCWSHDAVLARAGWLSTCAEPVSRSRLVTTSHGIRWILQCGERCGRRGSRAAAPMLGLRYESRHCGTCAVLGARLRGDSERNAYNPTVAAESRLARKIQRSVVPRRRWVHIQFDGTQKLAASSFPLLGSGLAWRTSKTVTTDPYLWHAVLVLDGGGCSNISAGDRYGCG